MIEGDAGIDINSDGKMMSSILAVARENDDAPLDEEKGVAGLDLIFCIWQNSICRIPIH